MTDINDRLQSILSGCAKLQKLKPSDFEKVKQQDASSMQELVFQLASADNAIWEAVSIVEDA